MLAEKIERGMTAVLTLAALIIAGTSLRREFFPTAEARTSRTLMPVIDSAWTDALPVGVRIGDSTARVTVVVFSDLECPACAAFHQTMREVLEEYPRDVSLLYVHFPLGMHRFAVPAAQAAECAGEQGRFLAFIDAVFAKQDSLGIKSWGAFARDAGVVDTASIDRCARNSEPVKRVQDGRELALKWQLRGTPTVIVAGKRYPFPPGKDELERAIRDARRSSSALFGGRRIQTIARGHQSW